MATPAEPPKWWVKNYEYRHQFIRAVGQRVRRQQPETATFSAEAWEDVQKRLRLCEETDKGWEALWPTIWKYWNKTGDRAEWEVGGPILSNPPENLIVNGGFRKFSGTTPNGWTATGTATTGSTTARTGAFIGNNALAITTAGATGGMEQSTLVKPGSVMHLGLWMLIVSGSATVRILSDGATPYDSGTMSFAASTYGASAWFAVPTQKIEGFPLAFDIPSDATTLTVTLAGATNSNCRFSDVQLGLGPVAYPDLWTPANSDVETLLNVETLGIGWQTASAINADQNDYAPGTGSAWRISTSGSVQTITGMSLSQTDGQELHLRNVGSAGIVLAHQSASSAAANRFLNFNGYDLFLPADAIVTYKYDSTTSRWVGVS